MFNGYNETPLISYEFNQERGEKKHENVVKWSYGHEAGGQPGQTQPGNRTAEYWPGKCNFLGIPNVVKCNCAGCYPPSEKQSYQGDAPRHRPWLPRTFSVPVKGSSEPCKLPAYQWDNGLSSGGPFYPEGSLPFAQENGGAKYSYYKHYQNSRGAELNQPGVITSVKNAEYEKKSKMEMPPSRGQESPVQNGTRQPVFCNPAYGIPKRGDGRNYCDPVDKYSNVGSYSVDQHTARLPVVEPFTKAVPSNLSQSRVPSTGYRSMKETMPQTYLDLGYGDPRKACAESTTSGEKRCEGFPGGHLQGGAHADYSHLGRELADVAETQKLFFDTPRHFDYYSRANFQDPSKKNGPTLDTRKDCAMSQMSDMTGSESHYAFPRLKYQEVVNSKPSCDAFYPKDYEKTRPENHLAETGGCFPRCDDGKNENVNVHPRLLLNDLRFADRTGQNSFNYQSNPVPYRNYLGRDYSYQSYGAQPRCEYLGAGGVQKNDLSQYRVAPQQQLQSCEQLNPQQGSGFGYDFHSQLHPTEKGQPQFYEGKVPSLAQGIPQPPEMKNPTHLESIRSEELSKNGTSKISPLRLLRKKKFVSVPQESAPAGTLDPVPGLDVRKFWSTWAEEEEENVAPTQMVVLDCQNIDPEQAKLLHLYETDSGHVGETNGNGDLARESAEEPVQVEESKTLGESTGSQSNVEEESRGVEKEQPNGVEGRTEEGNSGSLSESETLQSGKCFKKGHKSGEEMREKKKSEAMDKWTEKKFDFLKRSEESKAAEILRHEEEKKKIFETRLSLQQSLKKMGKPQEKDLCKGNESIPEKALQFDENSQSDSPERTNQDVPDLPTSEYRRNKFLDYADGTGTLNGEEEKEKDNERKGEEESVRTPEPEEIKTEKDIKLESPTAESFPSLNSKFKEEGEGRGGLEMEDILKRISEMNFQCPEVKSEKGSVDGAGKKLKSWKKPKRKKLESKPESEERTDRLTVETATKPTIKFSIQKSHDLKISFKVLNRAEYSDEETGGEEARDEEKSGEDSKNSTELITLRYKSIQRDGERSDSRKSQRRKKRNPKTPVLKIKKSRYIAQVERDPLAQDGEEEEEEKEAEAEVFENVPEKHFADANSRSEGFQVQETMDSAKIKLTFKRHKGNFETEYEINGKEAEKGGDEEEEEEEEKRDDGRTDGCRKKSRRGRRRGIFAEAGVETFRDRPDSTPSDPETDSEAEKLVTEPVFGGDSGNPAPGFQDAHVEGDDFGSALEPESFVEFVEDAENYLGETGKREEEGRRDRGPEELGSDRGESEESGKKQEETDGDPSADEDAREESTPGEVKSFGEESDGNRREEKKIQEISFDFIGSTKSEKIESNCEGGKTEVERRGGSPESNNEEGKGEGEDWDSSQTEKTGNTEDDGAEVGRLVVRKKSEDYSDGIRGTSPSQSEKRSPVEEMINDGLPTPENITEPCAGEGESSPEEWEAEENNLKADDECNFTPPENLSSATETNQQINSNEIKAPNGSDEPETKPEPGDDRSGERSGGGGSRGVETGVEVDEGCFLENLENSVNGTEGQRDMSPAENEGFETHREIRPSRETPDHTTEEHEKEDGGEQDAIRLIPEAPGNGLPLAETLQGSPGRGGEFATESTSEEVAGDMETELEDGEIIDSCDEPGESPPERKRGVEDEAFEEASKPKRKLDFPSRRVNRRRSGSFESQSWSKTKFWKAKSCPPEMKFEEAPHNEMPPNIPVQDIPLPMGPPPRGSCFDFNDTRTDTKEKSKKTGKETSQESSPCCPSSFGASNFESCRNSSPPISDTPPRLGIFERSSKIRFSFFKRSKISKISLSAVKDLKPETPSREVEREEGEKPKVWDPAPLEEVGGDSMWNRQTKEVPKEERARGEEEEISKEEEAKGKEEIPKEKEAKGEEEIPKEEEAKGEEEERQESEGGDGELEEGVEVMDPMGDLVRDEFYECEDIPTSEDLTNGDDLEIEKVNDDKFRNIMQNCLDNAKKFLNVGNLKLFSCSVDDLLELDCQAGESPPGGGIAPEKPPHHISRDVLLTSCEDTNEDLGLAETAQSADISMDFVSSFCSDVCPEILPVDNWPYLEEEVPSSPAKSKPDDADLIPSLENAVRESPPKESPERARRKRVASETCYKRARRKSRGSDEERIGTCSRVKVQRRKTIEGFTGVPYGRDVRSLETDIMRLKKEAEDESVKCRSSLEKITRVNKERWSTESGKGRGGGGKILDYKSPSWQPKVMLFRISKNELRKILRSSKNERRVEGKTPGTSPKRKISSEVEDQVPAPLKKQKSESGNSYEKEGSREGKSIDLSKLDSIKGSLSSTDPEMRKRKKSRFRNLHSKRKCGPVDAETAIEELFKDRDSKTKNGKGNWKDQEEKPGKMFGETGTSTPDNRGRERQSRDRGKEEKKEERHQERKHRGRSRGREEHKHREKVRESKSKPRGERSPGGRRRREVGEVGEESPSSPEGSWVCEVCGFSDADERVLHIKNHPFHCQSCHLAFKTEAHFINHLTKKHKDIRNQHHCLLCELSFDTEEEYLEHLETREHRHLESVEKNTINALFTLLTGAPCPVFGLLEMKPEWLPNQAGTVHFYHQATPLSLALQYLKMRHDLSSFSTPPSAHTK